MKIKLVILAGGSSPERAVSFQSAEEILKNISKEKYDVFKIEVPDTQDNLWIIELMKIQPDIVFNVLHGGQGENGSVQGLLECLGVKYVGSKVFSSSLCMNKAASKEILRYNNIPVPEDILVMHKVDYELLKDKFVEMNYPLIVKPNCGGSSIDICVAENYEELKIGIENIHFSNDDALVEKYILGREITCCVIQINGKLDVFAVLDIVTKNKFYDYTAKYENSDSADIGFTKLPKFLQTMIKEIAKKTFSSLNCEGFGIVDMIVLNEQVYVLEVNTLPGLTKNSIINRAVKFKGMQFSMFLDSIINEALL